MGSGWVCWEFAYGWVSGDLLMDGFVGNLLMDGFVGNPALNIQVVQSNRPQPIEVGVSGGFCLMEKDCWGS